MIALIGKGVYIIPATSRGGNAGLVEILTVIGVTIAITMVIIVVGMALIAYSEKTPKNRKDRDS